MDASATMADGATAPLHIHAPCGAVHDPVVITPGDATGSTHRHEPLAIARLPDASTVKLPDLWLLRWHENNVPRTVTVP